MKLFKIYSLETPWSTEVLRDRKLYFSKPSEVRQKDDPDDLSYSFPVEINDQFLARIKNTYDHCMEDIRIVCLTKNFNREIYKNLTSGSDSNIKPGICYEFDFEPKKTGVSHRDVKYLSPRYSEFLRHWPTVNSIETLLGISPKSDESHFFDHVICGKDSQYAIQDEYRFFHSLKTDKDLKLFTKYPDFKVGLSELGLKLVTIHLIISDLEVDSNGVQINKINW